MSSLDLTIHQPEMVPLTRLRPHPRNYRVHPPDQLAHLKESIQQHGFYRNLVVANDYTVLAGHGVLEASAELQLPEVPVIRLDLDPDEPRALMILTADNEIALLAEINDRQLTEMLVEINERTGTLLGTGYDAETLASLIFITRPPDMILANDATAHWVGMPGYEQAGLPPKLIISFDSEADRDRLLELIEITELHGRSGPTWSTWWPNRERESPAALRFNDAGDGA